MNHTLNRSKQTIVKYVALLIGTMLFYLIVKQVCTSLFTMMVVNIALIYSLIAYSVSIMLGMGGELSFAGIAFMGGGAFLVANLSTGRLGFQLDPVVSFLMIIPVFALVAFVIGLILLRLKSTFFTFSTIALVQMCYTIYNNYKPLFGGADGIAGIPTTVLFGQKMANYYDWFPWLLLFSVLIGLLVSRIRSTPMGRSLASCRDNETAARVLGVNVYMTKVLAFTIVGVLAAMAGGLYALQTKFVSADMFNYANSTKYIIMAMIGGVQSTVGAFFGAFIVQVLPQLLKSFEGFLQLFWGVAIVLLMVFMPEGLAGIVGTIRRKLKNRKKKKLKAVTAASASEKGGDFHA